MAARHGSCRRKWGRGILLVSAALLLAGVWLDNGRVARSYTITDGQRVMTYTTFATDPAEVLEEAGLPLESDDSFVASRNGITISRGERITLSYHGNSREVLCRSETVGQLLEELDLALGQGDKLSHDPACRTYDGMELRIDRVEVRQERYSAALPHGVNRCADCSLAAGLEQVLIPGEDGQVLRTAEVTYINGQESARRILEETVVTPAVTEVVAVGTGEGAPAVNPDGKPEIGDGYIRLATGEVLTYTRTDTVQATGYTHTDAGCDYTTATGTTVRRGTVAVDPRFIPYGTRMFIVSNDGEVVYGIAVAEDCGGAIKRDRMDLYFPTYEECIQFGRRRCTLYFLG